MKKIRKITAVVCLAAMLISCFSFSASALVFIDGNFGYELNSYTKEMTLVQYDGNETVVTIPGTYGDYPVTKLGKNALSGNSVMQIVNMPTTMKKIEGEGTISFKNGETIHIEPVYDEKGKLGQENVYRVYIAQRGRRR